MSLISTDGGAIGARVVEWGGELGVRAVVELRRAELGCVAGCEPV